MVSEDTEKTERNEEAAEPAAAPQKGESARQEKTARKDGDTPATPPGPLVYQVAAGPAVGAVRPPFAMPRMSRRVLLLAGFWTGIAAAGAWSAGAGLDLIYPRKITGFGGSFSPGQVEDFPPGSKTHFIEGRFWVVSLSEEQGGPGLLALWQKCPHLGCAVPWREDFVFKDPATGQDKKGWFRCPCHGSTYTDAGVRGYGPAPRSMDSMKVTVDDRGNVHVDTGVITPGGADNASRALKL